MISASAAPVANRLLAGLPSASYGLLLPHLEPVALAAKRVLLAPGTPAEYVYFPTSAVLSLVADMREGLWVEAASIGREGMVGTPLLLGGETLPWTVVCQVPGAAVRLPAAAFQSALTDTPSLQERLHRYVHVLLVQLGQGAACTSAHPLVQRCARWLLRTHDQVGEAEFPLTQEFLAAMLAVRRATVTTAVGALRRRGLIEYRLGRITIRDRPGLEAAACVCYQIITAEYDRLLG